MIHQLQQVRREYSWARLRALASSCVTGCRFKPPRASRAGWRVLRAAVAFPRAQQLVGLPKLLPQLGNLSQRILALASVPSCMPTGAFERLAKPGSLNPLTLPTTLPRVDLGVRFQRPRTKCQHSTFSY